MAEYDKTVPMNTLKSRATNLLNCVEEATKDLEISNTMSVAEFAS